MSGIRLTWGLGTSMCDPYVYRVLYQTILYFTMTYHFKIHQVLLKGSLCLCGLWGPLRILLPSSFPGPSLQGPDETALRIHTQARMHMYIVMYK